MALALIIVVVVLIGRATGDAKRAEQALNDLYGDAPTFVPSPDGSIDSERIEAFLRVRGRLSDYCVVFQDKFGILIRLNELEQDGTASRATVAREGIGGLKELFKAGRLFLLFMEARNEALLEEQMGLGEYIYIYALAYSEQLGQVADSPFAEIKQAYVGDRARNDLVQILRNQLDLLAILEDQPGQAELAAALRAQLAGLSAGEQRLPWEDGLPSAIAASLEPYANNLADSYCEGIAKVELMQKNKGLNIKN